MIVADQRMIHRSVVCSDEYTELSYEAQALYIQLTIEADSFGFVGGIKKIMRSIGVGPDALEELVKARFVLRFDSGVFVIRHWMVGNGAFKNDRGYEAKYPKELAQLFVDYDLTYVLEDSSRIPDGFQMESPSTSTSSSTSSRVHNVTQVIRNALQKQGIIKESAPSSSVSSSPLSNEGESSDEDTDPGAEAVTYEEYLQRAFPGRLKELLSQWVGFTGVSVNEIRAYLSGGVSAELIMWAAGHAVDREAASPRNYVQSVIEDKRDIGCLSLAQLLEVEGNDRHERESIWRIAQKISELRGQIENEWHQMRGER